jgi:hypothetical protein
MICIVAVRKKQRGVSRGTKPHDISSKKQRNKETKEMKKQRNKEKKSFGHVNSNAMGQEPVGIGKATNSTERETNRQKKRKTNSRDLKTVLVVAR